MPLRIIYVHFHSISFRLYFVVTFPKNTNLTQELNSTIFRTAIQKQLYGEKKQANVVCM